MYPASLPQHGALPA